MGNPPGQHPQGLDPLGLHPLLLYQPRYLSLFCPLAFSNVPYEDIKLSAFNIYKFDTHLGINDAAVFSPVPGLKTVIPCLYYMPDVISNIFRTLPGLHVQYLHAQ